MEKIESVDEELATLLITGLDSSDHGTWSRQAGLARAVGFVRWADAITKVEKALLNRTQFGKWDRAEACRRCKELYVFSRVAAESAALGSAGGLGSLAL